MLLHKLYQKLASRRHSRAVTYTNKILTKWGIQPLFTGTREQLHDYWMMPPEEANRPEAYLEGRKKSEYLVDLIKRFGSADDSILELGCNVGRNLFCLWGSGYKNISGIEMNEYALQKMRRSLPAIDQLTFYNGLLEDVLPEIEDKKFDIVFSMAVLEHVHPSSNFIFKEIGRICRRNIITIEIENSSSARVFPRNYKAIFEKLGWVMIFHEQLKDRDIDLKSYTVRVFQKKAISLKCSRS